MRTLIDRYALPRMFLLLFSALLAFQPAAFGQDYARPVFTQQELDQMLAPIALYPDPLLSQILMASTYPLEVVVAARWSRAHRGLRGDEAVRAVADKDWDPSVKSLVAFPQVLAIMDQKLEWTERLGEAFLAQEPQVMRTVQDLRHRAHIAGNLTSNDQIQVYPRGSYIEIEPASPQVVYVPYYDPLVVYGSWWWPAYRPVYWDPWPGYYSYPGYTGFAWGSGIGVSVGFFFGGFDWHQHRTRVVHVNNYYYNRNVIANRGIPVPDTAVRRSVNVAPGAWQHDPAHRRGAPYRTAAVRERFAQPGITTDARRDFRRNGPMPAPDATRRQAQQPAMRGADAPAPTQTRPAAPRLDTRDATVPKDRRRDARGADADSSNRGADARARLRDNPAPNRSQPEARSATPRPDTRGAAPPEDRRRDTRGANAESLNRGAPASRPEARGGRPEFNREAVVRPAEQPVVSRPSARASLPPPQPAVEQRQPRAPAPPPQGYAETRRQPAPPAQMSAPAQNPGKGRGSQDFANRHDRGDKGNKNK